MRGTASSKSAGNKVVNPKLSTHMMASYLSSGDCEPEGVEARQPKPDSSSDDESDRLYGGNDDKGAQERHAEEKEDNSDPDQSKKRVRYAKVRDVGFEISKRICFKCGYLQKPIVAELKAIDATQMLKVTGRQEWLCKAATGRIEKRGAFETTVTRVKAELIQAITQAARAGKMKT